MLPNLIEDSILIYRLFLNILRLHYTRLRSLPSSTIKQQIWLLIRLSEFEYLTYTCLNPRLDIVLNLDHTICTDLITRPFIGIKSITSNVCCGVRVCGSHRFWSHTTLCALYFMFMTRTYTCTMRLYGVFHCSKVGIGIHDLLLFNCLSHENTNTLYEMLIKWKKASHLIALYQIQLKLLVGMEGNVAGILQDKVTYAC